MGITRRSDAELVLSPLPHVPSHSFKPPRIRTRPCVVEGIAKGWSALDRWNADYLKRVAGESKVVIRRVPGVPANVYQRQEPELGTFTKFVEWVVQTSGRIDTVLPQGEEMGAAAEALDRLGLEESYYLDVPLAQLSLHLFADISIPTWYPKRLKSVVFWCGIFGSSSGLHFDVGPNCNVQVFGRKQFVLFPPQEYRRLYPMATAVSNCRFDPNRPDFEKYPRAAGLQGWKCTLERGQALYIPPGWYHQVTVASPWAINVNFWWATPLAQGVATPVLRRVLLTRWLKNRRGVG